MRDFYPEQMRIQNWLFSCWRESAARYGFDEYNSSVVEQEELFVLKSGEEIVGQLFNFTDKGSRGIFEAHCQRQVGRETTVFIRSQYTIGESADEDTVIGLHSMDSNRIDQMNKGKTRKSPNFFVSRPA